MSKFKTFKEWLAEAIMDPKAALEIFGLAEFPKSATELRTLHKKLAMSNHPDRGGSLEKMKDINAANDVLKKWIGKSIKSVAGATTSGSGKGNAQAYKQAGETFKKSNAWAQANRAAATADTLKTRGPIYEAILKCFKGGSDGLDFFGCVQHLTNIFGEPFTHVEKASTAQDIVKMKNPTKESWVSHLFVNKSKTMVFEIELIGDSDHMVWLMRHKPNGFDNSKKFDFEWTFALNVWTGNPAKKKVITRRVKYRRADLSLLRDAAKMLPAAKLAKLA